MVLSMSESEKEALSGKVICLGVTGSIACYKAADLTSELRKLGAEVYVVMTDAAQKFVSSLTFSTLSRNPVSTSLWEEGQSWQPGHIELADQADLFLVAPATANAIANFARGNCPDLLSTIYLATPAPVLLAPAMNGKMFEHQATQANLDILKGRGVKIVDPVEGELACGYVGLGKMAPVNEIVSRVATTFSVAQ